MSDIKAGGAYVEVFAKDVLQPGLTAARKRLVSFAHGVAAIGGAFQAGAASIIAPLTAAVMQFTSLGGELADVSARTDLSVEMLSALGYAAKLSGGSLKDLQAGLVGIAKFTFMVQQGGKGAKKVLEELGISTDTWLKSAPDQRLGLVADALTHISDPSLKAALAMKVLGKGGLTLLPILADGSKGLAEFRAEAQRLGLVFTDEEINRADRLGDAIDTVKEQLKAAFFQVGDALAPLLQPGVDAIRELLAVTIQIIDANPVLVTSLASLAFVLAAVGAGFLTLAVVGYTVAGVMMLVNGVISVALGLWSALGTIKAIVAAINTYLSATFTTGGIAALFASIQTFLFAAAESAAAAAGAALGAVLTFLATPLGLIAILALLVVAGLAAVVVVVLQCTDALATLGMVGELVFGQLYSTATQAFQGIFDALSSGNLALAGQIAMQGLYVVWLQGVALLKQIWEDLKLHVMQTMISIAQFVADKVLAIIEPLLNLADSVAGTNFSASADLARTGLSAAKEGAQTAHDAKVAQAFKDVADAQKDLSKLTSQAATERKQAEEKRKLKLPAFDPAGLGNPAAAPGGQSLGTFSGAVAHLLGRSGSIDAAERTADATEEARDLLKDMEDDLSALRDSGGLNFA